MTATVNNVTCFMDGYLDKCGLVTIVIHFMRRRQGKTLSLRPTSTRKRFVSQKSIRSAIFSAFPSYKRNNPKRFEISQRTKE